MYFLSVHNNTSTQKRISEPVWIWGVGGGGGGLDREERAIAAPKWVFHLYASGRPRGVLLIDKEWPLRPRKTTRGPAAACNNSSITAAPTMPQNLQYHCDIYTDLFPVLSVMSKWPQPPCCRSCATTGKESHVPSKTENEVNVFSQMTNYHLSKAKRHSSATIVPRLAWRCHVRAILDVFFYGLNDFTIPTCHILGSCLHVSGRNSTFTISVSEPEACLMHQAEV